jgi:hypothetical protein
MLRLDYGHWLGVYAEDRANVAREGFTKSPSGRNWCVEEGREQGGSREGTREGAKEGAREQGKGVGRGQGRRCRAREGARCDFPVLRIGGWRDSKRGRKFEKGGGIGRKFVVTFSYRERRVEGKEESLL